MGGLAGVLRLQLAGVLRLQLSHHTGQLAVLMMLSLPSIGRLWLQDSSRAGSGSSSSSNSPTLYSAPNSSSSSSRDWGISLLVLVLQAVLVVVLGSKQAGCLLLLVP